MQTRFEVGQRVRAALANPQVETGTIYIVVGVVVQPTPFGDFVTYHLVSESADGAEPTVVRNGHLLLEEVVS